MRLGMANGVTITDSDVMFVRAICRGCKNETLITDKLPVNCELCGTPFFTYQHFSPEAMERFDRAFLKTIGITSTGIAPPASSS